MWKRILRMLRRGEVGCRALNDHGNYIIDHGKIMEKSWNFVFEFLWEPCKKDILKLTGKSCEIYFLTIYAYFMMRTQVISHKLHISEVSFPDQSFTI